MKEKQQGQRPCMQGGHVTSRENEQGASSAGLCSEVGVRAVGEF